MKLLDILSGYTSTSGSPLIHFAYMLACATFTFGFAKRDLGDQMFLDLVDQWFWTHLFVFFVVVLMETVFINHYELKFLGILAAIFIY
jgi:hypothetical protein